MPYINKPKRKYYGSDKQAYKKRQKIYQNPLWQKMRLAKLMEHPTCAVCEMEGKIKLAMDVHHIISFVKGKTEAEQEALAFDYNNIIPLCKECHWEIHHGYLKGATSLEQIKQYVLAHLKQQDKDIPNENEEQTEEENKDWFF